ncbi:Ff.00g100470.m01.CDS01 [Fusarium sp. VM40]|nr:Ff.00g100470.m01.CDS01 [Fusarium sp. VM40]
MASDSIVIVGAGIIGLDVALALSEQGHGKSITIIAEYLPGDTAASYTSPWAGCNFSAISGTDANAIKWDMYGYAHLRKLASENSDKSFVKKTPSIEFWDDNVPHDKIKAMGNYLEDFRVLPDKDLPQGVKFGCAFTTLTINAPEHCQYLHKRLRDEYGVTFVRKRLPSIHAAYASPTTKVVFNCTGLAAETLEGVPISNGNVILGGYMQKGVSDNSTYSHESESILERTIGLSVELQKQDPEVLAAFSGLRPSREGGARIERSSISVNEEDRPIVHNYGAGGTGFQAGYGMALDAVKSIEDILSAIPIRASL